MDKELKNAFLYSLTDENKVHLWNEYVERNLDKPFLSLDSMAIPIETVEDKYPIDAFSSIRECVYTYALIVDENGSYKCKYVFMNEERQLEPFDLGYDLDVDSLIEDLSKNGNHYEWLPEGLKKFFQDPLKRSQKRNKAYVVTQYDTFINGIFISKNLYKTCEEAADKMQEMIISDLKSLDNLSEKEAMKVLDDAINHPTDKNNFCEYSSMGDNAKVYFQKDSIEYIVYQINEV